MGLWRLLLAYWAFLFMTLHAVDMVISVMHVYLVLVLFLFANLSFAMNIWSLILLRMILLVM